MKIRIFEAVLIALSILLLLWVGLSFVEVWLKNMSPNPSYSAINLFNYMTGGM